MRKSLLKQLLCFDNDYRSHEGELAGVDEAGRGPLAGPVVAAAVMLNSNHQLSYLNDSKQILPSKREKIFIEILKNARIGIGVVEESIIDEINIYQASRLAMKRAVLDLATVPECLLIDGKMKLDLPIKQIAIVKGDAKSAVIAAASIVAKVYRDRWMGFLDELYPFYEFSRHKGYATQLHRDRLRQYGPSPVHRKTFAQCSDEKAKAETENQQEALPLLPW